MQNHGWNKAPRWALGAVVAGAFLCLPGTALAAHDLYVYKAEQQVILDSDDISASVNCKPGDYALDGMWRVDHVDQDEDSTFSELMTSTDVNKAKLNPTGDGYDFRFVKNALGRTQVKIFVTCLGQKTDKESGHDHGFTISANKTITATNTPVGNPTFDALSVPTFAGGDADPGTPGTQPCSQDQLVVSPSFEVTGLGGIDPPEAWGKIFSSNLDGISNAAGSTKRNSWTWSFRVGVSPLDITVSVRCLTIKLPVGVSGTKHKLTVKRKWDRINVGVPGGPDGKVSETSLICGDHYKAMVAGWTLRDPDYLWFQGMDPRLKSRAYRFFNSDTVSHFVDLKALCFNYRTT